MIPNKLIVSTHKVKRSILGTIIEENSDLFDNDITNDADFNILALFVMFEYLKGKDSFFHPMFQVSDQSHSIISWNEEDLKLVEESAFIEEVDSKSNNFFCALMKEYASTFLNKKINFKRFMNFNKT